jgi:DNA-binding transcriptional LysR family regulator
MATLCRGKWNAADVLLARTTRGAALTEAGVTFREHAARRSLPAGDLRGRLRIAALLWFRLTHLAPVLADGTGAETSARA